VDSLLIEFDVFRIKMKILFEMVLFTELDCSVLRNFVYESLYNPRCLTLVPCLTFFLLPVTLLPKTYQSQTHCAHQFHVLMTIKEIGSLLWCNFFMRVRSSICTRNDGPSRSLRPCFCLIATLKRSSLHRLVPQSLNFSHQVYPRPLVILLFTAF
jgi:hypothetical protein